MAGGLLSGKYDRDTSDPDGRMSRTYDLPFDRARAFDVVDLLRQIAARHGATPAAVAIAWLLAKPAVTSVLIGVTKLAQLEDNLSALRLELDHADMAALDQLTALPAPYPNWFTTRNLDKVSEAALSPPSLRP